MNNKELWRIFNLQRVKNISASCKAAWSQAINEKFIAWLNMHPNLKKIGIYVSLKSEVNTMSLIKYLLTNHYEVYLPVITNVVNNEMQFSKIINLDYASCIIKGIKQPISHDWIKPIDLQVIIIPVTGFNLHKDRIGKGYGYYDKYLKKTNAIKIGFAFAMMKCFNFIADINDVPLDLIMTESEII